MEISKIEKMIRKDRIERAGGLVKEWINRWGIKVEIRDTRIDHSIDIHGLRYAVICQHGYFCTFGSLVEAKYFGAHMRDVCPECLEIEDRKGAKDE